MNNPTFTQALRQWFRALTENLLAQLREGEQLNINLSAEDMLYLRFNASRVRQNTDVSQRVVTLTLQANGRSVEMSRTLSGQLAPDQALLTALLADCRSEVPVLPADPHQVPMRNNGSSEEEFAGELLDVQALMSAILGPAQDCDLAGLYAGGFMVRANRNSVGQDHWFATQSFFLDYSLYHGPKAAKGNYAGARWDAAAWVANLARTRSMLELLQRPAVKVQPGQYRTYLAPRAFSDLVGMLGWNALSAGAWKQGRSPFKKLAEGEVSLSEKLTLGENFAMGLTPRFNAQGEVSPGQLPLIHQGRLQTLLVNSRTAKEYGLQSNAAAESEAPRSLEVMSGTLPESQVLAALDTGLYLSNLHYLNWSDPVSARVTGMTRFACFWVEKGQIVGPIEDLRWDQSLFDALGPNLLALTDRAEIDPACDTYFARATGGAKVPGALIDHFTFTL